jgi:aminopeptidase N
MTENISLSVLTISFAIFTKTALLSMKVFTMRFLSLLLLICSYQATIAQDRENRFRQMDVQRYQFELQLNDADDQINGKATIDILFLQDMTALDLDLINYHTAKGKGMKVSSVQQGKQALSFTHTNNILRISAAGKWKAGESAAITINYSGIPADGLIISKNKYGKRTFFGDNWPNRGRNWLPLVDHSADKAALDFIITAPAHYQVVANGVLVEETSLPDNQKLTHWKETVPLPPKVMVIGLADFAVQYAGDVNCIPVYSWVYPEEKTNGFYDYAQATEILPFFIKNVGPYPYRKLANVQSKTLFGGMENAGAIFYYENSINGKRTEEPLLAHEIAHQWFGNSATEAGWYHIWLSESFATYMTDLYLENKNGFAATRSRLESERAKALDYERTALRPIVDSSIVDYMDLLNPNSYEKGAWVLHMLRRKLGDSIFWKGIRSYYDRYKGRNAVTQDLQKVMEEVSRKPLQQFFKQWIFTAGHPELKVKWQYDPAKKEMMITVTQTQATAFSFPLELGLRMPGGTAPLLHTLEVNQKIQKFNLPLPQAPAQVILDPNLSLYFRGDVGRGN